MALGVDETPPPTLTDIVAAQLKGSPTLWDAYARRDQTRREHQQELVRWLGLLLFTREHYKELAHWLVTTATQATQGTLLARTVVDELSRRRIVVPPVRVIELLVATASTRAQREIYRLLTAPLSSEQRQTLDALLEQRPGTPYSTLAWLRTPPGAPSARGILAHIERLRAIRALGLPADIGRSVHQNRLLRIAREAAQTAVTDLREYQRTRRHATLVALLVETAATLTDEIVDLLDRMIGSFFAKAKHAYERSLAESGDSIQEKVRLFAQVGTALIEAKAQGQDAFAAIEALMPWEVFAQSVEDAQKLAHDASFDQLTLVGHHKGQLRRYAPAFLETLKCHGAPVTKPLLEAIEVLKGVNASGARRLPEDAPTAFVRWRGAPVVMPDGAIDRKFYALCAMSELKNALRSGDIWAVGSRQFREFDEYLLSRDDYAQRVRESRLGLKFPYSAGSISMSGSPRPDFLYLRRLRVGRDAVRRPRSGCRRRRNPGPRSRHSSASARSSTSTQAMRARAAPSCEPWRVPIRVKDRAPASERCPLTAKSDCPHQRRLLPIPTGDIVASQARLGCTP